MKAFDPNYKLLDEMYQDNYYATFLVDKVKDELQKVIDLLESGETDTEVVQETDVYKRQERLWAACSRQQGGRLYKDMADGLLGLRSIHPPGDCPAAHGCLHRSEAQGTGVV